MIKTRLSPLKMKTTGLLQKFNEEVLFSQNERLALLRCSAPKGWMMNTKTTFYKTFNLLIHLGIQGKWVTLKLNFLVISLQAPQKEVLISQLHSKKWSKKESKSIENLKR